MKRKEHASCKASSKRKDSNKVSSSSISSDSDSGSEENEYLQQVLRLKAACADWDNLFSPSIQEDRRILQWQHASVMGEPLLEKYAWAIPSNYAIKLLTQFSPIVEIGAGKGYWAHLVQKQGGYIMPFDIAVSKKDSWTKVSKGDPSSILSSAVTQNSNAPVENLNLFLCYPDQSMEIALPSLENFQKLTDPLHVTTGSNRSNEKRKKSSRLGGGYVVHVGELLTTGCASGAPQAPWGRTSSPHFQERLYKDYHCIFSLPLESFPFSRDFLTVWKRTVMFNASDLQFNDSESESSSSNEDVYENRKNGSATSTTLKKESEAPIKKKRKTGTSSSSGSSVEENDDEEEEEDDEDDDEWSAIPSDERLPHTVATVVAPFFQDFLKTL